VDRGYINDPTDLEKNKAGGQNPPTDKDCGFHSVGSPKPCLEKDNAKVIVPPRDAKIIVPPRDMTKINPINPKTSPINKGYDGGR
jgi:hypothetical protein